MPAPSAADIIASLDLKPHPEGGYYRETFRDTRLIEGRAASTAILFLLARGQRSHWHRVDAVEIWHYHAGAPLKLSIVDSAAEERRPQRRSSLPQRFRTPGQRSGRPSARPRTMMPKWSKSVNRSRRARCRRLHRYNGALSIHDNALALIGKVGAFQKNMVYTLPRLTGRIFIEKTGRFLN